MILDSTRCSFCSVTVAFNAAEILPRQVEALLAQTLPLNQIVVVDNSSNDNTCHIVTAAFPQVTVLRMSENIGAAGAWAAGLVYAALEKRHDWTWTFDADSVPDPTTLERMVAGLRRISDKEHKVGIVVPMGISRTTGALYPPWLWREGFVKPPEKFMRQPLWFADLAMASGSLISKDVVQDIGLPRADFFMDVFDLEYCIRARSKGYKIAVVTDAKLGHEIGKTRKFSLFGSSRQWMMQPAWREYYISRNLAYLAWRLYPSTRTRLAIAKYLAVHFVGVLLFSANKRSCVIRMLQGLADGLRSRLGIRFRPGARHSPRQSHVRGSSGQS